MNEPHKLCAVILQLADVSLADLQLLWIRSHQLKLVVASSDCALGLGQLSYWVDIEYMATLSLLKQWMIDHLEKFSNSFPRSCKLIIPSLISWKVGIMCYITNYRDNSNFLENEALCKY